MAQLPAQTVALVAAELTSATIAALHAKNEILGGRNAVVRDEVYDLYRSFVDKLVADGGEKATPFRPKLV